MDFGNDRGMLINRKFKFCLEMLNDIGYIQ